MKRIVGKIGQIEGVALVAAMIMTGFSSDAVASHRHKRWPAHGLAFESCELQPCAPQLAWQPPLRLGPMRYYGGPKYPMWRGPVEN